MFLNSAFDVVCQGTCQSQGQGACTNSDTECCPYFATDGACTLSCPPNFSASNTTGYTCSKYLPNHVQELFVCSVFMHAFPFLHVQIKLCVDSDLSTTECGLPCSLGYAPNPTCSNCSAEHICLVASPCENGATCNIVTSNITDYKCSCTYNHTGVNCEGLY